MIRDDSESREGRGGVQQAKPSRVIDQVILRRSERRGWKATGKTVTSERSSNPAAIPSIYYSIADTDNLVVL